MSEKRSESINALIDYIDNFEVNENHYFADLEPQSAIDNHLTSKVDSLRIYFKSLGWINLVSTINDMLPFRGNAVMGIEVLKSFVLPEAKRLLAKCDIDNANTSDEWLWHFIHPRVSALARPRFEAGFYADSVESVFKELNDTIKRLVIEKNGIELDGAKLMTTAFSVQNPIIKLNELITESDKNTQQGYMQILAGSMTGIRNPQAHENLYPDSRITLHLITLASLLMYKLDERING